MTEPGSYPEPYYPAPPPSPAPRAAASIAALVLLLIAFVAGIAVGQSGLTGRGPTAAVPHTPGPSAAPSGSPGADPTGAPLAEMDLFWQALELIRTQYVGRSELDDRELVYGAIRGLVEALGDTGHSVFLTPEEVESEQNSLDGSVVGIGVLLGEREGRVVIVSVVSGSPAQRAGILAGDAIVAVDGEDTADLAPDEIASIVRGDEGTTVVVTIARPATGERLDFSIVRERIRIPAATWAMVPGTTIGVLRLNQFSSESADELRVARDTAVAAGATRLILDLRGNPGGLVDEAVRSASLFLRDRTVYIRETADGERIPVETLDDLAPTDQPLVVLIDENTASSGEILAGALKSAGRGPIIGTRTFGTGTVLIQFPLDDGSAVRLAIERWLTPEGELIFGKGIEPTELVELGPDDVPIEPDQLRELTADEVAQLSDPQLLRAIELSR